MKITMRSVIAATTLAILPSIAFAQATEDSVRTTCSTDVAACAALVSRIAPGSPLLVLAIQTAAAAGLETRTVIAQAQLSPAQQNTLRNTVGGQGPGSIDLGTLDQSVESSGAVTNDDDTEEAEGSPT